MQQPWATVIAPDCRLRRHCQIDIKRSRLRTRVLQQLVAPLVLSSATPTIMANPIDAAVKARTSDIIHLDAAPATRKPAADAASFFRLFLKSNFKPESVACRSQSLQSQLERIQS